MDLRRTVERVAEGRRRGQHLGAILYVAPAAAPPVELAVGEARPGVPLEADLLVPWLSATKPVTAVAIAQLWERGALELDDPVCRHLPEFAANGKETVTVRHLLTHTGGIRTLNIGSPNCPWEETIARIAATPLEAGWVPGEKAAYHMASSWFILGEVVRRLSGRPFQHYLRRQVLEPLGMTDSWVGMPDGVFRARHRRLLTMYRTDLPSPRPFAWHDRGFVTRCSPGGNGWGPIRDLGKFYEMLLGGGSRRGARVLSPRTVAAMTDRQRVGLYDHGLKGAVDWGLGLMLNSPSGLAGPAEVFGRHASPRSFGHGGYRSSFAMADPEHRLVIALIANGLPGERSHRRRLRSWIEAVYEDLGLTAGRPAGGRDSDPSSGGARSNAG